MTAITSPHNERIKLVRALQTQGKTRRERGLIALEGVRLVADALAAGATPEFVLYASEAIEPEKPGAALLQTLAASGVACFEVPPALLSHAAETQTPQGMIAVVPVPRLPISDRINLVTVLDGVADPGNLGAILRTAAAAGVDVVMLAPHCVDPFNPKALRSGMGAHFRVPILRAGWPEIEQRCAGLSLYVADAEGATPYCSIDWTQSAGLIIGGEARGADSEAWRLSGGSIAIPMANASESLNAAIAAGVILFEIRRQRLQAGHG